MHASKLFQEADRQLTICNACRYCEGYCPVFRAIEHRREFAAGDILYLANLCHDCRACYYACMYTPPHEFAINIPQIMADVRIHSYERWSWPAILSRCFSDRRISLVLAAVATALVFVLALVSVGTDHVAEAHAGPGAFYQVVPFGVMWSVATLLFCYAGAVWIIGGFRFWSETGNTETGGKSGLGVFARATSDAIRLTNLKGGGPGCYYPQAQPAASRRLFHSLVFWGFLFAFLSTTLAAIYQDLLGRMPPYPFWSAPVMAGTIGGLAMIAGTAGLIFLKMRNDSAPTASGGSGLEVFFLAILGLVSATGMLTLALRGTRLMPLVLTAHLGVVAATLITAPYSKFVHLVYRFLAIVRFHAEEKH